jgi:hypothetical protein
MRKSLSRALKESNESYITKNDESGGVSFSPFSIGVQQLNLHARQRVLLLHSPDSAPAHSGDRKFIKRSLVLS